MRNDSAPPEAVLLRALELKDRLDYAGVIALCDPASIESAFRERCEYLRPRTEEEFLRDDPDFPVAQAATVVAALNRQSVEQIRQSAQVITTYEEFAALDPADHLRHSLERRDFRLEVIRRMREREIPVPAAAYDVPPGVTHQIIDVLPLNAREVNVKYRTASAGDSSTRHDGVQEMEYETLRRADDGTWWLVARYQLLVASGSVVTILGADLAQLFRDDQPSA